MNSDGKALEIIQNDIKALYLGNLNTVEFDLNLPSQGGFGSTITWESGNSKIISEEGKVNRPIYGNGNREVELIATFHYGEVSEKKTYLVTVLEQENKIKVAKQYAMTIDAVVGKNIYLPDVTVIDTMDGRTITHAVTWNGGNIRQYNQVGSNQEYGALKGTDIPVVAIVTVQEELANQFMETTPLVKIFDRGEVHLTGDSPFKAAQDRTFEFLLSVNDDQMLYNFRRAAGLNTKGAPEMIGWDSPDGLLRGHTTGHYLSSLALCYRATKDETIRNKAIYMIDALSECQETFSNTDGFHAGFLSAYSEEQFDLLEVYTRYPQIWAPYYTLHKIMAGLVDCYQLVGIQKAFDVVTKLGDWVYDRLSRLSHEQRCRMWSMYIAGEFGGLNETMAELYKMTGEPRYIETARMFDNDRLYYPMSIQVDALNEMHANQHIPQVVGTIKMFQATGEKRYYDISEFFWEAVTDAHCYAIGGTGEAEMFHAPNKIGKQLSKNTAESCASYNMLKLTKELYCYKPDKAYMDYYERTMTNHILATCDCEPNGATIYFLPLAPGYSKGFDVENSCCHGTGLENHFRYVESIFYQTEEELYINLFLPSELDWKEKQVKIHLSADELTPGSVRISVKGSSEFTMKIRIPYWCVGSYELTVNHEVDHSVREENGYLVVNRTFRDGDIIQINYHCSLRMEQAPDAEELVAIFYGPYVLAAITEDKDFLNLNLKERKLEEVFIQKEHTLEFHHTASGVVFKPLYQVHCECFQAYVKIV